MRNPFAFHRKKLPPLAESVPQLTLFQRRALREPGVAPGLLSYTVYEQMQRDAMVQTVLTIKRLAVMAAPFSVTPADDGPEARRRADFVLRAFDRMEGSPLTVLTQAMDAFAKGWSVQELVFEGDGEGVWLRAVRAKDPSLFGLDVDPFGRVRGLALRVPGEPERELPRGKFVIYANRRDYAQPKGRSDLDAAYGHWQAKQALLAAWRVHLERFAMPTVLGKYVRGLPPDEQTAILRALQDLPNNTAIVYPSEIEIGTLGGDKAPSTGFQEAIEFHNREIARAVLGQTLTTDEGRRVGSLALGKVHLQVLMLQVHALRRELADSVMTEQVIRPLVELNFGPGPIPRFAFPDPEPDVFAGGKGL